jgi:hypothetical protein
MPQTVTGNGSGSNLSAATARQPTLVRSWQWRVPMRPKPRLFPAAAGVPATALLTPWTVIGQWANGDFW